jgi:hypothetical protein
MHKTLSSDLDSRLLLSKDDHSGLRAMQAGCLIAFLPACLQQLQTVAPTCPLGAPDLLVMPKCKQQRPLWSEPL